MLKKYKYNSKKIFIVRCSNCSKELTRKRVSKSGLYFCNREVCKKEYFYKKNVVECDCCGKKFPKCLANQRRTNKNFCSRRCQGKFYNKQEKRKCLNCNKIVVRPISQLEKHSGKIFCSKKCVDEYRSKKIRLVCPGCGKFFKISPVYFKRTIKNYCSKKCFAKCMGSRNYAENEMHELIKENILNKYDNISCVRNNRTILKPLELDFWFPEIKFAIEVNGRTHYRPIFGSKKLKDSQSKDRLKRKKCKTKGIKLRVVKPGNPMDGTRQRRYKQVIYEIKNRIKKHYNL